MPLIKKNLLFVEDDQCLASNLELLFKSRDWNVTTAHTGREALDLVSQFPIDIIVLDINMPEMDGFEVCRRLKSDSLVKNIPIIIVSANLSQEDIVSGLYMGADDYLTKPFDFEELMARMDAIIRRSRMNNVSSWSENDVAVFELKNIIQKEKLTPVFQPIILLENFKVYGFEALTRPQSTSTLANPELLFKRAIELGCYHDLEVISWKKALKSFSKNSGNHKLFLNCNPYLVEGMQFVQIKSLFDQAGVKPSNVVLEITERSAISDYKIFYNHIQIYRESGFSFAVDDVGGGYASLESVIRTRPEILKIDRHIVSNLHQDPIKRSIIKFVVNFCKENNILSIAEGIECVEELNMVKSLNVDAAQGFFIYKPSEEIDVDKIEKGLFTQSSTQFTKSY